MKSNKIRERAGRPHHRLEVWKRSIQLVSRIYQVTAGFPHEERFGLVSQMRRAAVSIPSNIAEGAGRHGFKEFVQFLYVAQGSTAELETQLIISNDLGYIDTTICFPILEELDEISRMIVGLQKCLRDSNG